MSAFDLSWLDPLSACIIFTVLNFGSIEILRNIVYRLNFNVRTLILMYEFLGALSFCTCHYAESIMFDNYGYIAMIVVSSFNINLFYHLNRKADEKLWENGQRAHLANEDFRGYDKVLRFLGGWFSYVPSYLCWTLIRESFGIVLKKHGGHYPYSSSLLIIILVEFIFGAALRVMYDWYSDSKLLHLIPFVYAVIFSSGQQVARPPGAHPIITFVGITMGVEPNFMYFLLHAIYIYAGWFMIRKLPLPQAVLNRAPYRSELRAQNQKSLNKNLKTPKGYRR